jgi:hypothetical protein
MFAGYVAITVITIVAVAGIAAANFARARFVLATTVRSSRQMRDPPS